MLFHTQRNVAQLYAGDSFGELALLNPAAERRATVICKDTCEMLKLHRTHYEAILKSDAHRDIGDKIAFLKHVPLFRDIPYSKLEGIAIALNKREVSPKQAGDDFEITIVK